MAEALSTLRGVADEIIIAADVRVGATDLAYYADVADTLVRYEHPGADRQWSWLVTQARGDWVLLLDGDELPSAALVAALPELAADRRIRQYSLPIHWPWPAPNLRLAEEPWISDRRLRLVRNDSELAFAARQHALAESAPPIRYLDELPVYHLDLLIPDRSRREAKAERYESELFGLLTAQGVPFNQAFYLPEAGGGGQATVPLPVEDAEHVARALNAPRETSRQLDPASLPVHDAETITWFTPRTVLPDEAYRAAITLARPLPPITARCHNHLLWVEVTNEGTARWPGGGEREPLIRLGLAWRSVGGGPQHDAGRALLPHALDPGQRALLPIRVGGPPEAGHAELVLDLVHENVRWFGSPLVVRVEAGPSADQRLSVLTARHGPLIPLEAAMHERRAVGACDGLLCEVGDGAIDGATIDRLVELVRDEKPRSIVEFGSGTSTVVLASLLAELHQDGLRLVSFEQDPARAAHSRAALAERGLDRVATVAQLPLGERPAGYLLTEEAIELLRHLAPQLILVDGPTHDSGTSRIGALDIVAPYLRRDATVLLDDALRDSELRIAAAWERRDDVVVHGIRPTPKGLLEAALRAPKRHRRVMPFLQRAGERLRDRARPRAARGNRFG